MGRRRSRKRRSASVQLARSATGSRVDSLMRLLLGARLFASMRERRDERHDEEEDHPEDHQQVRDRDQDERPVQVRGRRIHAGHLLASAFHPRLGLARTCWPLRAPCPSATRRLPSTYDEAQSQPRPAPVVSVSRRPDRGGGGGGRTRVCDTRAEPGDRVASSRWVDVPTAQNLPRPGALRLLDGVRWLLPLVLAVVAWTFEWTEHVSAEQEPLTPGFYGEVFLFGVLGPVVVAIVLTWVRRLVATLQATSGALGAINRDLGTMVAERTANLQAATQEL